MRHLNSRLVTQFSQGLKQHLTECINVIQMWELYLWHIILSRGIIFSFFNLFILSQLSKADGKEFMDINV